MYPVGKGVRCFRDFRNVRGDCFVRGLGNSDCIGQILLSQKSCSPLVVVCFFWIEYEIFCDRISEETPTTVLAFVTLL